MKKQKSWRFKVGRVKGGFGETNFDKKTITIDKAKHKKRGIKHLTPNKDGSENMAITIQHELNHKRFPKKSEKEVERMARKTVGGMSRKRKAKLYSKFSKKRISSSIQPVQTTMGAISGSLNPIKRSLKKLKRGMRGLSR